MSERYERSEIFSNNNFLYDKSLQDRNIKVIKQYGTQELSYPDLEQISELTLSQYVWKQHDKFWRLSDKYYGDPKYWWVISFYNKKPTEAELKAGDVIIIPQPLDKILFYIKG